MPAPKLEGLEDSISNSRGGLLASANPKGVTQMLRKALTLGMVFIFALSLLLVSMVTCLTYDAQAHEEICWWGEDCDENGWNCVDVRLCFHQRHNATGD